MSNSIVSFGESSNICILMDLGFRGKDRASGSADLSDELGILRIFSWSKRVVEIVFKSRVTSMCNTGTSGSLPRWLLLALI